MVRSCAAIGCTERFAKGSEISFHCFPADELRRTVWTLAMKRKNFQPNHYTSLCSKHFSPECFDTEAFGIGRKLKSDAVPSIFNFPKYSTSRGRKKLPQFERNTQKVLYAPETETCSTKKLQLKRRKSRKIYAGDYQEGVVNFLEVAKNSCHSINKKLCTRRQKSRRAVTKDLTAQSLQADLRQEQITNESIIDMLEVELYPHLSSVNVKQEPEDPSVEEVDEFVNEEVRKKPRCCSVAGCKSNYRSQNETVSTFSLPIDERLKKKWLKKIPSDLSKLKRPVICIKHFKEGSILRTEQFMVNGELKTFVKSYPELKPDAVPTIFPKHTTNNKPQKRRRASRKSYIHDSIKDVLDVSKNSLEDNKKKRRRKTCQTVKKVNTNQASKQNKIFAESFTEMLQVELYPHMSCVNVKQEPEDPVNEDLDNFAIEEFMEDPLVTTGCNVIIKEEPELQLGADAVENSVFEDQFQTSPWTNIIKQEPQQGLDMAGAQDYVGELADVFVVGWCPASVKEEVVCDHIMLEPQVLQFSH